VLLDDDVVHLVAIDLNIDVALAVHVAQQVIDLDRLAVNVKCETFLGARHGDFFAAGICQGLAFTHREVLQVDVGILTIKLDYPVILSFAIHCDLDMRPVFFAGHRGSRDQANPKKYCKCP
jgi:hypothetical protein